MNSKNSNKRKRSIKSPARRNTFERELLCGFEALESRTLMAGLPTLIELVPGLSGSNPQNFTNVNNTVFFTSIAHQGNELWKTDGTLAGTTPVRDIRSGLASSNPFYLTNVNGTLFFSANDGINGIELWKSDGTELGTVIVKDIRPGVLDSSPTLLTNVNGTLFFNASDGVGTYNNPSSPGHGSELWRSDGTNRSEEHTSELQSPC